MTSAIAVFVLLYGPVMAAALSLVGIFRLRASVESRPTLVLQPFGSFFDVKLPLSSAVVVRSSLIGMLLTALSSILFIDYSSLFPRHLEMEIFYDTAGIKRSLGTVPREQVAQLEVPSNFEVYREHYFGDIDKEVKRILKTEMFFGIREGSVHSSGRTTFVVEKTNGIQTYHIVESKGELTHTLEVPRVQKREFYTVFEKLTSADDYISVSVSDLVLGRGILLRPQFKQILAEDRTSVGVVFKVRVVGITNVRVFPWPRYSNTIYCADFGQTGLIPVAYAIYK